MPSPLRAALIDLAIRDKWTKIDLEPVPLDGVGEKPTAEVPAFRHELRLLLKAVVDIKLAEQNQEYTNDLQRVPWANRQVLAFRAANRLMEISEWADEESGEEAGSMWARASRIAELLGEDYSGWKYSESYEDIASLFFSAVRGGFDGPIFRQLLADLERGR